MVAMKGLIESKKALYSGLLIVAVSVLTILKIMSVEQWIDYTKWVSSFYVGSAALQEGLSRIGTGLGKKASSPTEVTVSGPIPTVETPAEVPAPKMKAKKKGK